MKELLAVLMASVILAVNQAGDLMKPTPDPGIWIMPGSILEPYVTQYKGSIRVAEIDEETRQELVQITYIWGGIHEKDRNDRTVIDIYEFGDDYYYIEQYMRPDLLIADGGCRILIRKSDMEVVHFIW